MAILPVYGASSLALLGAHRYSRVPAVFAGLLAVPTGTKGSAFALSLSETQTVTETLERRLNSRRDQLTTGGSFRSRTRSGGKLVIRRPRAIGSPSNRR